MCNDLPERQFLAILRRNQLLLHRCKVWLIFNMPISHLAGNKLSSTALPHTGCTAHQKVLSPGSHLTIEGQLRIHLLPPTSLQEVYGGVVGLAELVVISTHEIRELPEASRVGLELGKFLRSEGVIRNDDLASGKIEEDDLCKEEVLIVFCLGLVGLPPQHLLDLEDIQQEGISLLSVLLDCLPLPRLVHIHIQHLREEASAHLFDDIIDIPRHRVVVMLALEEGGQLGLLIEEGLPAGQLRPIVSQMHNLDMVVGMQYLHLRNLRHEIRKHVIIPLGQGEQLVSREMPRDVEVSDVVEVGFEEGGDQDLTGPIDDDQLRVQLLPKRHVIALGDILRTADDLIVPADGILRRGELRTRHEDRSQLVLPLLDSVEEVGRALDDERLAVLVEGTEGGLGGVGEVLVAVLEGVLGAEGGLDGRAEDEVPDRLADLLMQKLHFKSIDWEFKFSRKGRWDDRGEGRGTEHQIKDESRALA